ncbi:hypothetical protein ACQPYK_49195 (plasmid) [Streptosporangium sp. CA-135522]|uniref:hypothetical protein n=1 Tax=Streptosporangium sp. CA-135522 TaxID=3240072 RepID=UPI003D8FCB24
MEDVKSPMPDPAIPGWRVIRSDAGRYWASREKPFPDSSVRGTGLNQPPFRTVDADTIEELRAEVEQQENAAREAAKRVAS